LGLLLSSYSVGASLPAPGGSTDLGATLPAGSFNWDQLRSITQRSFAFTLPSAVTLNFIKNNTDAELLAKPQLRISEGQKAQLIIGDKTPIPTTTFTPLQHHWWSIVRSPRSSTGRRNQNRRRAAGPTTTKKSR
jgi:hypothetical protein